MTDEIDEGAGQTADVDAPSEPMAGPEGDTPVASRPLSEIVPEVVAGTADEASDVSEKSEPLPGDMPEPAPAESEEEPFTAPPAVEAADDVETSDAPAEDTPAETPPTETPVSDQGPAPADGVTAPVPAEPTQAQKSSVAWWPFLVYGGLWLVFAGLLGYSLYSAPDGVASVETPYYPYLMLAGVALTLAGPALALLLYFNRRATTVPHAGLFATLLLRAATFTVAGVAIWWIVLIAADVVRLGRFL